ncbi:Acetyltransferase (GNAT) family protein [Bacteroidales bacterium Barb6XT]|nr:Acetyltransferase (GNAT) family protein [Bacteroidales bacterium Barb6XT]
MNSFQLIKVIIDTQILPFDCGNTELNGFLFNDAKTHLKERIAATYLLLGEERTVAYWSYLNDKITVQDLNNNYTKFAKRITSKLGIEIKEKEYKSIPSVKIGRLGVDKEYTGHGIGSAIINHTRHIFSSEKNKTGCRFITVDAFRESIPFYLKNGFEFISSRDRKSETRQMYCDLFQI